jgi:2-polyprenyl-6-methoxyphenol hydroxylase-like FAD-dependent oxidoreductase
MVTFAEGGQTRSVTARVVIGADGRFSRMREWGGFTVRRDPDNLRIAGALATGVAAPDDGIHLCGLALIGDAAGATDPSWGCGLSKALTDAETLANCLSETDDWNAALERYAAAHDDYGGKLHNITSWMTELIWSAGPAADARRAKVLPRMEADPTGFPDSSGQGPFGPSDENARRLILGEW